MTKSILCAVIFGIVVGTMAFFVPKMLLGIFIFCAVMRLFHCCCHPTTAEDAFIWQTTSAQ